MRYRCLVLDHDDTVTDSTAHLHYPAFLAAMDALRPGFSVTLEEYFRLNYHPGFVPFCRDVLGFTEEEFRQEYIIWQSFVNRRIPEVYPGMARIIRRQKAEGGLLCVVSHSVDQAIRRDYAAASLPEPDLIYGWERPPEERKPSVFPLRDIMNRLGLKQEEMLMVDDLKPGADMARECGVPFAAALWAHQIPEIHADMKKSCPVWFSSPEELEIHQFGSLSPS